MKVIEFKKLKVTEETILDFNDNKIKVKTYLPQQEKEQFINLVTKAYFDTEDNKTYIADVYLVYGVIKWYTNINLPQVSYETEINGEIQKNKIDDVVGIFDVAMSSGLFGMIENIIPEEIEDIRYYVDENIEHKEQENRSFNKVIEGLKDTLVKGLNDATDAMNGFDPEKLGIIKEFVNKSGIKM